jgi:hypothetical protein
MRFRKLQIAWSVLCGIACVLLIALWVRSHRTCDRLHLPISDSDRFIFESNQGRIMALFDWGGTWQVGLEPDNPWGGSYLIEGGVANDWPQITDYRFAILHGKPSGVFWIMPHWFPVLLLATSAVAPWYRRIRWRFSLRTLLIATTLVAVVLGLVVYFAR